MPKISALPAAASVAGADLAPIVQGGVTKKATYSLVLAYVQANIAITESQVTGLTADLAARLIKTNNLSDVTSASTSLANLNGLSLAGGTMAGSINMGTFGISNAANPSSAQDLATKFYVDQNAVTGTSVYAASAGSLGTVTQSGAGTGATLTNAGAQATFALDGVNPPVGSNVLIKNTATGMSAANEGIYTVTSVGSGASNWVLTRATFYDTAAEINRTGVIAVQNGSTLASTGWVNTTTIVTVDTTNFSYISFGFTTPVSLANGGTSAALTASNGGIFYSTASAGAILSGTATAGLALLSGANTTPSWSTAPPITKVIIQTFAAGSSTYTPTTGMKFCTVEIVGGGGSGGGVTGGTAGQGAAGSGGGGGGYCRKTYTATLLGATAAVVVGTGGAAATSGANNGNNGVDSTFTPAGAGAILTASAGLAGTGMAKSASAQSNAGGTGGAGTNGDLNIPGKRGNVGSTLAAGAMAYAGGGGGTALAGPSFDFLWTVATGTSAGSAANAYGGGSGGAFDLNSSNQPSNAAANGICYITEYVSV